MGIGLPKFIFQVGKAIYDGIKLKREGKEIGLGSYHSHPFDRSWSDVDLSEIKKSGKSSGYANVDILYRVEIDKFEALDSDLEEVEIKPIKEE